MKVFENNLAAQLVIKSVNEETDLANLQPVPDNFRQGH